MRLSTNRSDESKKYKCYITVPGCPCCGSVKESRKLKITQRRPKLKQQTRRIIDTTLRELYL